MSNELSKRLHDLVLKLHEKADDFEVTRGDSQVEEAFWECAAMIEALPEYGAVTPTAAVNGVPVYKLEQFKCGDKVWIEGIVSNPGALYGIGVEFEDVPEDLKPVFTRHAWVMRRAVRKRD
jgi:hypothetical protein